MANSRMTTEEAEAMFKGIDNQVDTDIFSDFLLGLYTSNELSSWKSATEEGIDFGETKFEKLIDAWVPNLEEGTIMSNEFNACCWRRENHGFKNGFSFALNIMEQMEQLKARGKQLGTLCVRKDIERWMQMTG